MRVFMAERGVYENRGVAGLYDSAERAMADNPGKEWTKTVWTTYPDWPDLKNIVHWTSWDNHLDWDDACSITELEIIEAGPLRRADRSVVQTLNAKGGWDYIEESPHA